MFAFALRTKLHSSVGGKIRFYLSILFFYFRSVVSFCSFALFVIEVNLLEKKRKSQKYEKRHTKSLDRSKTRKGGLGKKKVVRKALGLGKIGLESCVLHWRS